MILSLFLILLAISLILIVIGYWIKEGSYYMIGFFFMFLLGIFVMLPGNLEVQTGTTTTYNYTCGCCIEGTFSYSQTLDCSGTPTITNCSDYDGNEIQCLIIGCTYSEGLCTGTPYQCDDYTEAAECTRQGCEASYSTDCTNETAVISSETKTPTYTSFNDFLSHFFGFWITILATIGFIMSIGDIRRGIPK